jgi:hypothetical protein
MFYEHKPVKLWIDPQSYPRIPPFYTQFVDKNLCSPLSSFILSKDKKTKIPLNPIFFSKGLGI